MHKEIKELLNSKMLLYHIIPLEGSIAGFVYRSRRGRYHIFISSALNHEAQRRVFYHEAWHVIADMPRMPFIVGLNMQGERFEAVAEQQAKYTCNSS
ncbi:MAG: hypothetical protein ACOY9Y_02200 [Bacillota bacterium]